MNYEEAIRHYREGTATEEEKAFVQDEIAKAKALSTLLDDEALAVKPAPIKQAEAKEIKDAKQHIVWKRVLAGLIAVVVLLVVLGAVLGGVFGSAASYARDNIALHKTEMAAIAEEFAKLDAEKRGYTVVNAFTEPPREMEEKFNFETDLKSSYYSYEVEVTLWSDKGHELDYEIVVNSHTGSSYVKELEVDYEGRR